MDEARTVLVVGASSVRFPPASPEIALPALLHNELVARVPGIDWRTPAELLYPSPRMAERGRALLREHRPDVVYFVCAATYAQETVLFSIHRRWPRLHGPAARLAALFEGPAGEPAQGTKSPRSALFSAMQGVARTAVGVAPLIDLEPAIDSTIETLRVFADEPDLAVIVRLSAGGVRDPSQQDRVKQRVARYNADVEAECSRLGFTAIHPVAEMRRAGLEYTYEPDLIHGNLEARRFNARMVADVITKALDLGPPGGRAV